MPGRAPAPAGEVGEIRGAMATPCRGTERPRLGDRRPRRAHAQKDVAPRKRVARPGRPERRLRERVWQKGNVTAELCRLRLPLASCVGLFFALSPNRHGQKLLDFP